MQKAPRNNLYMWLGLVAVVLGIAELASYFIPVVGEICRQPEKSQAKECASYHVLQFAFLWIIGSINDYGEAITGLASIAIAWFTLTLKRSHDALAHVAAQQREILNAQHLARHRPHLKVRHVSIFNEDAGDTANWSYGTKITGGLAIVNTGGTKAEIIDSFYRIYIHGSVLPLQSPLDTKHTELLVRPKTFEIGESCAVPIEGVVETDFKPQGTFVPLACRDTNGVTVYVMGQIQYRDEGGNERFMGFCRKWNGEGTFVAVGDQDYEYED